MQSVEAAAAGATRTRGAQLLQVAQPLEDGGVHNGHRHRAQPHIVACKRDDGEGWQRQRLSGDQRAAERRRQNGVAALGAGRIDNLTGASYL